MSDPEDLTPAQWMAEIERLRERLRRFERSNAAEDRPGDDPDVGERKYRALFETSQDAILLLDPERGYLDCNPAGLKLFGVESKESFLKLDPVQLSPTHQPDGSLSSESARRLIAIMLEKSSHSFEWMHMRVDGSVFPASVLSTRLELDGRVVLQGTIRDITRLKEMEEENQRREAELRQLFEHSQIGIFRTEFGGNIVLVNPAILKIMGYESMEAMNEVGLRNIYAQPTERDRLMQLVSKGPVDGFETQVIRSDGAILDIILTIYPVRGDDGNVQFLEGNLIDITKWKQIEERLRQSEKMQAVGRLAGGIAHDFNNQLMGIRGFASLLADELSEGSEAREHADGISLCVKRASDLTSQLLAFSRKGKEMSVAVDMHGIVDEVVKLLKHTMDRRIVIQQRFAARSATTMGDPTQLQNAVLNLALNARDAMPDGGELAIETKVVDVDESYVAEHHFEAPPGRYVQISVSDSGLGMDEETQRRIFEPFFTTKEPGQGTGMGLAAAYGIARNHGGSLVVSSQPGVGSEFRLFLPHSTRSVVHRAPDGDAERKRQRKTHILLVEDEPIIREVSLKMLTKLGYAVTACADGEEALRFYEQAWQTVDVVIVDMIMPVLGGRETFIGMRKINPDVVAILSSGYSLDGDAQKILNEGVKGFIRKPYAMVDLARIISELVGEPRKA